MTMRMRGLAASGARRVLPALAIFVIVGGLVLLLSGLHVSMSDSSARNYGAFAVGLAGALLATRVVDFLFFDIGYELRRGTAAPALLRQIVSLVIFGLALGVLFQIVLSASLPALLATSAIITAVIGLALQETLGNLFSGLALALERTVQVGDMVRAGDTIGLVEQLSWRAIKVRTLEGNVILIPNSAASRERLEVYRRGGAPMARILRISLDHLQPPALARAALVGAVRDLAGLAAHPAPVALVHSFDDWAIVYELRYWLEDYARYLDIDSDVRERVWYRLQRDGIVVALPVIRQHQYVGGPLVLAEPARVIGPAVENSDLFAPLSPDERAQLARGARRLRFAPGEVVVREGDPGASMFLIAAGRVAVSVREERGASQKVALLETGSAFGEISLLTGEPRLATVRAVDEAVLVEIDTATLAPVLRANPALVERLDAIILERRQRTADRREDLRAHPVAGGEEAEPLRARIARFFGLRGLA